MADDDFEITESTGPLFTMAALLVLVDALDKAGVLQRADYGAKLKSYAEVVGAKGRDAGLVAYLEELAAAFLKPPS